MRRDTHPLFEPLRGQNANPEFPPKSAERQAPGHGRSIRIQEGKPALSRTYTQYFEFFVLKSRELDTPSFKSLILSSL
jgi:hypothetical protein